METFNSSRGVDYRSIINQSGSGSDIDRFIYSTQSGQGLGSFFGNFARTVVPFLGKAIKGSSKMAKPIIKNAAKELIATGAKRALAKTAPVVHKKHKRRKWQSL